MMKFTVFCTAQVAVMGVEAADMNDAMDKVADMKLPGSSHALHITNLDPQDAENETPVEQRF